MQQLQNTHQFRVNPGSYVEFLYRSRNVHGVVCDDLTGQKEDGGINLLTTDFFFFKF